MAARAHHSPPQPLAPRHNRAPQAAHLDVNLLPTLTDAFIDSLTKAQAQQWSNLVMPASVRSTLRKNCTVKERRENLKFLRDLKRNDRARAPPIDDPPPREPRAAAAAPQDGQHIACHNNNTILVFGDYKVSADRSRASAPEHPPQAANHQREQEERFQQRFDDYRARHPHSRHRPRYFGDFDIDPNASRGDGPRGSPHPRPPARPAASSGGGDAAGGRSSSSSSASSSSAPRQSGPSSPNDAEQTIYRRAADAYHASRRRRSSRDHGQSPFEFAREAGRAARDMHDADPLRRPLPRGYF